MALAVVASGLAQQPAASGTAKEWQGLLDKKDVAAAKALCSKWELAGTHEEQVEAQKCLANGVMQKGARTEIKGNDVGGGTLKAGYDPAAVDEALGHLNKGLALEPKDMSLNQGRLYLLETAGRYQEMAGALEDTLQHLPEEELLPYWLQYSAEMGNAGNVKGALTVTEVLAKHFPESHDVVGNMGAFHDMLKEWDLGLPFLRKAVELEPDDAIDTWNLGWALDHVGQEDEANKWMSASLKLASAPESLNERRCLYGRFLIVKRKQTVQGCALIRKSCGLKVQPAMCAVVKKPAR